uniref:Amyloid-beta A4 precursor protein-binding family A member 3 n=1 Tax=Esox lucius TaxID=8010 RepID=A0A3P8Y4L5_ESOLU
METDNCPAVQEKPTVSSCYGQQKHTACVKRAVVEPDCRRETQTSAFEATESEDLDSFHLIEPPPLDWRSDDSSDVGSVEELDDSISHPTPGPEYSLCEALLSRETLGECLLPLDTGDPQASPVVVIQEDLIDRLATAGTPPEQVLGPSEDEEGVPGNEAEAWRPGNEAEAWRPGNEAEAWRPGNEAEAWRPGNEAEAWRPGNKAEAWRPGNEAEVWRPGNEAEAWRPGDEDHTRIHHLLNRLQVVEKSPILSDSTSDLTPPQSDVLEPSDAEGSSLLTERNPLLPEPSQASGLLFSESHQRDLLGLLECTEMRSPRPSPSLTQTPPFRRGDMDAVVSVSYNREDGERFWDHFGNGGRPQDRAESMDSFLEDEIPEPVWMKLGEDAPEEVDDAENIEQAGLNINMFLRYFVLLSVPGPCDPEDLLDGVIFGAKYLGSTQLKSDKNPSTNARMKQAQEAVDRIKAPEGESQPMTEVDLFISTQRIKVLSADNQEAMMDHPLQMISYIADIGNIVVLMARRKPPGGRKGQEGDPAGANSPGPQKKCCMICHVFNSDDAQVIAQAIGQAFGVAYQQFLHVNGIKASELRPSEYSDYLGTQELFNGDLVHFSDSDNIREVCISKAPGEIVGMAVVESGWGSILPTVVVANLLHGGPAERCGALSIGDRVMSVNGTSLVGLPIASCQSIIRDLKNQAEVKLSIVHCPPVTMAIIKRPDPKFQLGFSVEDGIICSLMRGGIAERGGIRVGHRIIEINGQSVVATPHEKIIHILTNAVGEIHLKTMPASTYRLLTGQEAPVFL